MASLMVQIFLGALLLTLGAELLRRGLARLSAARLAAAATYSGLLAPAAFICVKAATGGSPDTALGTLIGSVIAVALGGLGASALFRPIPVIRGAALRSVFGMVIISASLLVMLCQDAALTRDDGLILLLLLAAYLAYRSKRALPVATLPPASGCTRWCAAAYAFVGLALLSTGSDLLTNGALGLGLARGISEAAMAATLVAVITLLPLAVFCAQALRRGDADVFTLLSQFIIFLVLGVGGLSALFMPLPVSASFRWLDLVIMLAATVVFVLARKRRSQLGRMPGIVLVALYGGYVIYRLCFHP